MFILSKGVDIRCDAGFSLALAFWSRSAVLLDLNRGSDALVDIQCAIDNGLDELKKQHEYYARLAKANARKLHTSIHVFYVAEEKRNIDFTDMHRFLYCVLDV